MTVRRPTAPSPTSFDALGVPAPLVAALAARDVTAPFPIQAATLPDALAGRDVLGRGRTGSGKTYAFGLPLLARLAASRSPRRPGRPRALVLAPTRELATQIEESLAPLARTLSLRTMTVFGGVGSARQIAGLRAGVDVLVACPGRLADHLQGGHVRLDAVEITVLDEADQMADLGFLPVVRRLLERTPPEGQRMLFSATLDAQVDVLVRRFLPRAVTHRVDDPTDRAAERMAHHLLHVNREDRLPVLVDLAAAPGRTLVFTRTKRGARALTRRLLAAGVTAVELHGNLAQNARHRNLRAFADGSARTLVATDIAARGIHVDGVTLVVHADPPVEHKAYLHRSGRTARAGESGTVVTLMTDEQVRDVGELTRRAGVAAVTTRARPGHPVLTRLAPGPRTFAAPAAPPAAAPPDRATTSRTAGGRAARGRTATGRGDHAGGATPRRHGGAAAFSGRTRAGRRGRG